jgi:hypothetical protein
LSGIIAGAKSIGLFDQAPQSSALPPHAGDTEQLIQNLLSRVDDLQTLVAGKADANRIKTLIQYSDETIRIQAEEIALVGAVTFLDIWKDHTGQLTGQVDPSLTRIRGGVIQTGTIISNNWGASAGTAMDLDDGIIIMGGSDDPKFLFEDGDLTISGTLTAGSVIADTVTVGGTQLGTIKTNALAGYTIQQQLEVSGTTVLKGSIVPTDTGAVKVGTITWNATTGALTGGTGVAITEFGILGAASGSATFTVEATTGNATFAGTVTAGAVIAGSVTLSGVSGTPTLSTVAGNALAGYSLQQALEVSGTTVLKGVLVPTDTGALKTGSITWNSTTGALTGGTGVAITEFGIIGAASGSATFSIDASTGAAVFAGSLSAATGTFAGSLSAATGTFSGTISTSGSVLASGNVTGGSGSAAAVVGQSSTQYGVHGHAHTSGTRAGVLGFGEDGCHGVMGFAFDSGYGVYAEESFGAGALYVNGKMVITDSTLVSNLNAQYLNGNASSAFSLTSHNHTLASLTTKRFEDLDDSTTWTKVETSADGSTVASTIYVRKRAW